MEYMLEKLPVKEPLLSTLIMAGAGLFILMQGLLGYKRKEITIGRRGIFITKTGKAAEIWAIFIVVFGVLFFSIYVLGKMDYFYTGKLELYRLYTTKTEMIDLQDK